MLCVVVDYVVLLLLLLLLLNAELCVHVISRVHCAPGCVYILLTLLFLYCALRTRLRLKRLINTLLHYITLLLNRAQLLYLHLAFLIHNDLQTG